MTGLLSVKRWSQASAPPLSGLRLVTTLPPAGWFGGNNLVRAREHAIALRELGAKVYEFDTDAIYDNNSARIEQQKADIIDFKPDAAIGTPHGGYIVQGGLRREAAGPSGGRPLNVFIDELELAVILFWDHALTQAAHYLLRPNPDLPGASKGGARQELKNLFSHPLLAHFFPDSGHAQELGRLGLGSFDDNAWYVQGIGRAFIATGPGAEASAFDDDVAFFGNIYLAASSKIPYGTDVAIARLRERARDMRTANPALSGYHSYVAALETVEPTERARLRLTADQSFYWRFLLDELSRFMNGEERLRAVQACQRAIAFFGNFNDPESDAMMPAASRLRGVLPYGPALAEQFRRTRVTIDVANSAFINGFSVKLVDCFAAGGFVLTNRRSDVERALGSLADEICYDNSDELAEKTDYFLGHDRRRCELASDIRNLVCQNYSAHELFTKFLPEALDRIKRQTRGAP